MAGSRSSPSPPPPWERSAEGSAHLSLFLDTDLGTHLALNVAADSTIRGLKSQVAVEHAAAFPDNSPVTVKSFQVLRKGVMYHLSDSMIVKSVFSKVKAGCFLHVKMVAAEINSHHFIDEDRGRSSRGCLGVDMDKRLMELPAAVSSGVLPQMLKGTEEAKDQCGYSGKAAKSDIMSTMGEGLDGPYKRQIASNVQQGDRTVIENSDGDGKLKKKKKRHHSESSKDDPTQDVTKPSGFITNAHGESVNDPIKVKQEDSTIIENSNGDGKRRKKRKLRLESSKDDPTQDLTKSSGLTTGGSLTRNTNADPLKAEQTPGTIEEATGSDCRKLDGTVDEATTNVINEVLADLRSTDNVSGDPVKEHTKGVVSAALPLKYPAGNRSDDLNDVLTENTVVPADGRAKSTNRRRKKTSLKHVPTDSGKAIQSLDEQVRQVPTDALEGENGTKGELLLEGSSADAPASTGQALRQKSKRSLKTQASKIQEINLSTPGQDIQFIKDDQEKYVTEAGVTHNDKNTVGAPTESPVVHTDGITVTYDKPNARKGRKKSSKTEVRSQDTALEQGSVADLMNSRALDGAVIPEGSAGAVKPNDSAAIHSDNGKINFFDSFSPSGMNGPSDSAENNDEITIRELKGKRKSKRIPDMQSHRAGIVEQNDLPESHLHTDKTSVADHSGTGNVGVPSVSAENINKEDGIVKKAKDKKNSERKQDLVKPESGNPIGDNEDADNCARNLVHSVVQKGRMEQGNAKENNDKITENSMLQQETEAGNINIEDGNVKKTKEKKKSKRKQDLVKPESQNPDGGNQDADNSAPKEGRMEQGNAIENNDKVIQNNSMPQQEKEDDTRDGTHEKKPHQSMFGADSQTDLPVEKDHARMGKEQQTKHHGKNRKHDGSIDGRANANHKALSAVVQIPQASNERAYGTPTVSRFRVAVRRVSRKNSEQLNDKSKKNISKRGAGSIFSDTMSEDSDELLNTMCEKAAMENSSDDSSTSADSGISSTAWDGSDVPDDEVIASLSQRSDINSILRGSSSYKKARLKPTELLEDTEVPDSQPPDSLRG